MRAPFATVLFVSVFFTLLPSTGHAYQETDSTELAFIDDPIVEENDEEFNTFLSLLALTGIS
jgi:hypothetical protein